MTDDEIDNKYNTNSEKYRQQAYLTRQLDFPQASYTHTGHDLSKKQRGLTVIFGKYYPGSRKYVTAVQQW